ncbi:MAG TPA: class I SAM-dependent methyltransferase [Polyangiaceae bacterium]|nr:class I SAM-dependent methyltransferase [Polyangiaceae bacterium]
MSTKPSRSNEGQRTSLFPGPTVLGRKLTPAEVALFETFVVPRYLEKFGEPLLGMMLLGGTARVAHFGCRTGYPDRELLETSDDCSVVGVDASLAAIELARNKAATLSGASLDYQVATSYPTSLETESFSHAMSLHPLGAAADRSELFQEMHRVLYPGGQALVSLPLRGSFQEIGDLFREYALKHDQGEFGRAVELAMQARPTVEALSEELEDAGFDDVDADVRQVTFSFESGRNFTEDPTTRILILPELRGSMEASRFDEPLAYLNDAIGKYWSRREFELTVVVGTASARK